MVDCCNWYQTSHIHDLEKEVISTRKVVIYYTPGYADRCEDQLLVEISSDGKIWRKVLTLPVVSIDTNPPLQKWKTYTYEITKPLKKFRYVKMSIPKCYIDYSKIEVIAPYIEPR